MQPYDAPSERFQPEYHQAAYVAEPPAMNNYTVPFDYGAGSWSLNYTYNDQEYAPYQHSGLPSGVDAGIPLHAPVPVSGYSALLTSALGDAPDLGFPPHDCIAPAEESKPFVDGQANPLDVYLDAPQILFPTPSELLTDLNTRERGTARSDGEPSGQAPSKPANRSPAARSKAEVDEPENLNQRKAYFRSVSDNVGFSITDPDTITSHDKKRCYLECLEEYVQWMHEQLRLVGHEPLPLERVSSYRGLKSRSIRTMLVRKQEDISKLNQRKLDEERKFMDLQNAVLMRQVSLQDKRPSVDMGAVANAVPNVLHETSR
ncbi:hypothetical protein OH77DRAFT_1417467 [Trametes cingulata]|nr:hypothetical protein OH77DRAFT_1417467 [Trametes cingulata]